MSAFCKVCAAALLGASAAVSAAPPAIQTLPEGWYRQTFKAPVNIEYLVDSVARQCYLAYTGTVLIDCRMLARRPEWHKILTWVQ